MIQGIGVDLVELDRFASALERAPALRERIFARAERELPARSLAARFAAREAAIKALGGIHGLSLRDFEVVRDASGAPFFRVPGPLARVLARLGVERLHLSLTHERGTAAAFVIAEGSPSRADGGRMPREERRGHEGSASRPDDGHGQPARRRTMIEGETA